MKEIIDKLDSIKTKTFCSVKDTVKTVERQATEEVFAKAHLVKDHYPKYTRLA